jgi:transposase
LGNYTLTLWRQVIADTILSFDLGKFRSVCCWYDPETKQCDFATVVTSTFEFRRVLTQRPVLKVVIEAGSPAGWVHDICCEFGLLGLVAKTLGAAWSWKNVKRKTDWDDVIKLAKLAAINELPTVTVSSKPMRQWKSLAGFRKSLISERVHGQNRIRSLLVAQGWPSLSGARAWTRLGIAGIAQFAKPFSE